MSDEHPDLRVAVLLSGTGRTLQNLLEWSSRGELRAEVVAVAGNRSRARGLEIARAAEIPTRAFLLSRHESRRHRDAEMWSWLHSHDPQLVVLAGYLSLLDLGSCGGVPVINIHPSLLPSHGGEGYYGDRVHRAVLEAGETESGCTVHRVDAVYDRGEILDQERVPVRADDTVESLARRVFAAECELYPRVINAVARGELRLRG